MGTAIINLIIEVLKLVMFIVNAAIKFRKEEWDIYQNRINGVSEALKKANSNTAETMDEAAYTSNLEWEAKKRYDTYKLKALEVLKLGGGIVELSQQTIMGMGDRINLKRPAIILILQGSFAVDDKSTRIAKEVTTL